MNKQTRRQFLKDSAMAASAAALISSPMIIPSSAKAADKNDKLLCAVMGVSSRGGNHIDRQEGRANRLIGPPRRLLRRRLRGNRFREAMNRLRKMSARGVNRAKSRRLQIGNKIPQPI